MVVTPAPVMVTVPLLSTVALVPETTAKLTGRPELADALRLKLADCTVLLGMSAKVIVWSTRGVAVTIKGWLAVADNQGACPAWDAVMVTLPTLRAVATLPEKETTLLSLLSKVKALSPESDVTSKVTLCPACLSGMGWKVRTWEPPNEGLPTA